MDQRNAAFNTLLSSYPYSYYSVRAREILGQPVVAPLEIANGNLFPNVDAEIANANEPRLDSVRELTWLGLNREASAEMKAIAAAHPDNAGIAFRLADLYASSGEPFKAITLLQRNFRPFIRHGGSGVPRRFWEILFPLKYWESIRTEAQRRQIDPYLIASIIRQESGFEPTAVSNAGAVGIMQIMPHEAERIATAAGIQTPSRQELFDPHTNIAIGVAEYAQKLAVMRGTEVLAIAAYNAGEDVVGKWIAQAPLDDIDLFIESIPYNETRLYVKSVTRNRFEYRRIYEGVSSSS
jgi:soluble lytic murein transglycosylase